MHTVTSRLMRKIKDPACILHVYTYIMQNNMLPLLLISGDKRSEGGRNPLCLFVCFLVSKQLALNQGGTTLKWGVNEEATRGDGEERPGLRLGYPYHSCPPA
ncbi:unnamed protein product [Sphagnum troendelagicum]|uniref:Uncharacterized protein n=1 Tax=Sphagnum troendelagicum TaxID=128251 RepID=A0ABP0T8G8_9BRYO